MSVNKPRSINNGINSCFRSAILLVLLSLQPTCNATNTRTEPVPEWELNDEAEKKEKKPDNNLKKKDIKIDHIDDPFYTRYA